MHKIFDFWSLVDKGDPNECWEWRGRRSDKGYGKLRMWGKHWRAHRVSYTLTYGDIPGKLLVCHKCDNPPCCNPRHLFLGTSQNNVSDRNSKGRQARGETSGNSKLTWVQVEEIRSSTLTRRELSRKYGVSEVNIGRILKKETW